MIPIQCCCYRSFLLIFLEILADFFIIYQESQKYIKNADYDKYAREINNSELHKHIIERDRLKFYGNLDQYSEFALSEEEEIKKAQSNNSSSPKIRR